MKVAKVAKEVSTGFTGFTTFHSADSEKCRAVAGRLILITANKLKKEEN